MSLDQVRLDGKHERVDGELYLTGTQTLVKVAMLQVIWNRQTELLYSWHNPLARVEAI